MTTSPTTPLHLTLPPLGLNRLVLLVLAFALTFGGFGYTMLIAATLATLRHNPPALVFFLFPLPFAAIGTLMLYVAITQSLRRFTLTADPSGLAITSHLPFHTRTRRFDTPTLHDLILLGRPGAGDAFVHITLYAALTTGPHSLLIRRYGAQAALDLRNALRAAIWPDRSPTTLDPPPPGVNLSSYTVGTTTHIHLGPEPLEIDNSTRTTGWLFIIFSLFFPALLISIAWSKSPGLGAWIGTAIALITGIFLLTSGIKLLRQNRHATLPQAHITCDHNTLTITLLDPSPLELAWDAADIREITVAPSDIIVNHRPLLELHIATTSSPTPAHHFLGRDPDDLHWLATTLTHLLHVAPLLP